MSIPARDPIDALRAASRRLVRELGFLGARFAGTDLSPSAVHALIEIDGGAVTARDLAGRLGLEKSTVSRLLRKLIEAGDVAEAAADDGRIKALSLTPAGRARVAAIHAFARHRVTGALARLAPEQAQVVQEGISLYAAALAGGEAPEVEIVLGYRTGVIARITELHAHHYAQVAGFGRSFEAGVAAGLAEFCPRLDHPRNGLWLAVAAGEILGSLAIDGEDLGENRAHLRWFILADGLRGRGAGRRLMAAAMAFVDAKGFAETRLWTFRGLDAARHLYEAHGFHLAEERPGTQWGAEVQEQMFRRPALRAPVSPPPAR